MRKLLQGGLLLTVCIATAVAAAVVVGEAYFWPAAFGAAFGMALSD